MVFFSVAFVINRAGKDQAVYKGYTFYCHTRNKRTDFWPCTRAGSGRYCKARIIMTKDRKIKRALGEHNHERPEFYIRNGMIIKF